MAHRRGGPDRGGDGGLAHLPASSRRKGGRPLARNMKRRSNYRPTANPVKAEAAFEALARTGPRDTPRSRVFAPSMKSQAMIPVAAIAAYDALVADPTYDQAFKEMARILHAAILRVDGDDPKGVREHPRRSAKLHLSQFPARIARARGLQARRYRGGRALARHDRFRPARPFGAARAGQRPSSASCRPARRRPRRRRRKPARWSPRLRQKPRRRPPTRLRLSRRPP